MKTVTVALSPDELRKLRIGVTASGGINSLLRRLQQGLRIKNGIGYLTISDDDLARVAPYWQKTGGRAGSGGYQSRLPIRALRPYLQSVAPLFVDVDEPDKKPESYCYFKREGVIGDPARIKIGRGNAKRAKTGRTTDNHRVLTTLLRVVERSSWDERYFHHRFSHLRIRNEQEWFWAGDDLMQFIADHQPQHASMF